MSQAACPRCDETIRFPDAAPPTGAQAQCPWCRETFSFDELERQMPPMIQWVDTAGEAITFSSGTPTAAVAGVAATVSGSRLGTLADVDLEADDPPDAGWQIDDDQQQDSFSFQDDAAASDDVNLDSEGERADADDEAFGVAASPVSNEAPFQSTFDPSNAPPRRRKSASPAKTMIQMVLGGALAIPLVGLILFGLQAANFRTFNFGFWPFDGSMGPSGAPQRVAAPPMADRDRSTDATSKGGNSGRSLGELPDFDQMQAGSDDAISSALEENGFGSSDAKSEEETFIPRSQVGSAEQPDRDNDAADRENEPVDPDGFGDGGLTELGDEGISAADLEAPASELRLPDMPADVPPPFAMEDAAPTESEGDAGADGSLALPPETDAAIDPESTASGERSESGGLDVEQSEGSPAMPEPPPAAAAISAEMEAAANKVQELSTRLADNDNSVTADRQLLRSFYLALAEAAEVGSPAATETYAQLTDQLRQADQLEVMTNFGSPWIARGNMTPQGVFARGTLNKTGDKVVLDLPPDLKQPVQLQLSGWEAVPQDAKAWLGKEVVVFAKLEGEAGQRQGTIRYLEGLQ